MNAMRQKLGKKDSFVWGKVKSSMKKKETRKPGRGLNYMIGNYFVITIISLFFNQFTPFFSFSQDK